MNGEKTELESKKSLADSAIEELCKSEESFKKCFDNNSKLKKFFTTDLNFNYVYNKKLIISTVNYYLDVINSADIFISKEFFMFVLSSPTEFFSFWIKYIKYEESIQILMYLLDISGMDQETLGEARLPYKKEIYKKIFDVLFSRLMSIDTVDEINLLLTLFDSICSSATFLTYNYL